MVAALLAILSGAEDLGDRPGMARIVSLDWSCSAMVFSVRMGRGRAKLAQFQGLCQPPLRTFNSPQSARRTKGTLSDGNRGGVSAQVPGNSLPRIKPSAASAGATLHSGPNRANQDRRRAPEPSQPSDGHGSRPCIRTACVGS